MSSFEVTLTTVKGALATLRKNLVSYARTGLYTKARVFLGDRQILPDIPLAGLLVAEGALFWAVGPLAAVVANLSANTVLRVELVTKHDEVLEAADKYFNTGQLDEAESSVRSALEHSPDSLQAKLRLAQVLKARGQSEAALALFEEVSRGADPELAASAKTSAQRLKRLLKKKKS